MRFYFNFRPYLGTVSKWPNGTAPLKWTVSKGPQCPLFELDGAKIPEVAVAALAGIKPLDVIEDIRSSFHPCSIVTSINPLPFE